LAVGQQVDQGNGEASGENRAGQERQQFLQPLDEDADARQSG
jgi:hypothetical protein